MARSTRKNSSAFSSVRVFGTAALLASLVGCSLPLSTTRQAALPRGGAGDGVVGRPVVRPILSPDSIAQLDELRVQMGSSARPVIEPVDVDWLDDPLASVRLATAAGQEDAAPKMREVIESSVIRSDQRVDQAGTAKQGETDAAAGDAETPVVSEKSAPDAPPEMIPLYGTDDPPRSREALLAELHERLVAMEAPPLRRALAAVGLSLVDPAQGLDERLLEPLDPTQRRAVEGVQRLLVDLSQRIDSGALIELNAETVAASLTGLAGPRAVSLRNATLCRKVSGFGVYEPFEGEEFIAGRENRMIVYAEIDDFVSAPVEDGEGFEVRLEQEVVLYNEADGLAVWRHPAQPVRDTSRRQRRDFWVVQMVSLPANLGVGKYRLKVRVTDHLGHTVDETTLPIRLIADDSARSATTPTVDDESVKSILEVFEALQKTELPDITLE